MTDKKSFRKSSIQDLKKIANKNGYIIDKKITSKLYKMIVKEKITSIFLYIPLEIEVNIAPLIKRLRREKKHLYVPFMEGNSFRLVKYRLPLRSKQLGIKEPNNSNQYRKKLIDLAIVPMVATDSSLRRIGYGKGMYDRFFEKENKNINKIVFVARKLCYSKKVVTDNYDVKADIIIAP